MGTHPSCIHDAERNLELNDFGGRLGSLRATPTPKAPNHATLIHDLLDFQ